MDTSHPNGPSTERIRLTTFFLDMLKKEIIPDIKRIMVMLGLGAGIGLAYWMTAPHKFESKITFVVEEGKSSLGGIAAIAGQFGLDIPGASIGGLLAGDNVLFFLKSEMLCKEALLTPYPKDSSKTLASKYAEVKGWYKKWDSKFPGVDLSFNPQSTAAEKRIADSLLQIIVNNIIKKDLEVTKPDKKSTFVEVTVDMQDEVLGLLFSEQLMKLAVQKYVESRITIKQVNVQRLQKRADSLLAILNQQTFNSGLIQQPFVDANPALKLKQVPVEISIRDKTIVSAIYVEVVKNLEIAKVSLTQETPVIQIVDKTWPPLEDKKAKLPLTILFGMTFSMVIYTFYRIMTYFIKKNN